MLLGVDMPFSHILADTAGPVSAWRLIKSDKSRGGGSFGQGARDDVLTNHILACAALFIRTGKDLLVGIWGHGSEDEAHRTWSLQAY